MGDPGRALDAVRHPAAADSGRTRTPATSRRPTTCRRDAPLYYYSFTDAYIAMAYRSLTQGRAGALRSDDHRASTRPTCTRADHIRRVLQTFPGVFTGIGEFTHPQGVRLVQGRRRDGRASPIRRSTASSTSRARSGWSCSSTTTSTCRSRRTGTEPVYLAQMKALLRAAPEDDDHLGAHAGSAASSIRSQRPASRHGSSGILDDPEPAATSTSTSPGTRSRSTSSRRPSRSQRAADMINKYPDRFLFGTDDGGADGPGDVPAGLRHVRAALGAADARGEREGPQGQLRADLRRGPAQGPRVGEGATSSSRHGKRTWTTEEDTRHERFT